MPSSKVHSTTLHEPQTTTHPRSPKNKSLDSTFADWNYDATLKYKHQLGTEHNNNYIQPTPYMANLMDEYLFSTPLQFDTIDKTPKITSVVITPAKVESPRTPGDSPSTSQSTTPRHTASQPESPRSLNGCYICRVRHMKCDERKPRCILCLASDLKCEFQDPNKEKPAYLIDHNAKRKKLKEIKQIKQKNKLKQLIPIQKLNNIF